MTTKKITVALLTVALLLLSVSTLAAESVSRYSHIERFSVNLFKSSGTATCSAMMKPSSINCTATLTATLKKSTNGQTWTYVSSWSASGTTLSGASIDKTVSVSHGYQYKLFVTGKVYSANGTLLETAYKNSKSVEY